MRADVEIRLNGFRALVEALGTVEAERFVVLANRERFNYTDWRASQWQDETVASLAVKARRLRAGLKNDLTKG